MAINNRTLTQVTTDLTQTGTSELTFRNATIDVATQVDENDQEVTASRSIALTGDVTGSASYTLGDASKDVSIATSIAGMTVVGSDIQNNSITNTQIANGTIGDTQITNNSITSGKIATASKLRIRILNAAGTTLREFDGLVP